MRQPNEFTIDRLKVKIFETRDQMGAQAAKEVSDKIKELLKEQEFINMVFAAAPSQNEFLSHLTGNNGIQWNRINAFHMDEYIGLSKGHPQRFGVFLKERIFDKVPFHKVHYLNKDGVNVKSEIQEYTNLLQQYPTDIVCMGIGENTHIAFNDPHSANFHDPLWVKEVELDEVSRVQQVHDECFSSLADVPTSAVTLSVPALFKARFLFCMVPGSNKASAVSHTLKDKINEKYPSTLLRSHSNAVLYLDKKSAEKLH